MRKILAFILLLMAFQSFGQQGTLKGIDSLQQLLSTAKDSSRVDILINLAQLHYNTDMKQSLGLGEDALELATSLKYYRGIQDAHSILRRVHRRLGNYSVSIEYALKNLPLSEQLRDTLELLDSYTSLGNIYSSLQNFEEAQKYLLKALSLGQSVNSWQLADILNYIGRSYGKMGNYDSGQYYIQKALLREMSFPRSGYGLSYIYNNLAEIYYYKKEYDKAIEFYSLSSGLAENKKSEYGMTFTLNGLAHVYRDMKQYDKAIDCALKSIEISKANTFRDRTKEAFGILYQVYELKNDYKKALTYYKEFNLYQDSIFSEDRIQYIDNLKITYETEKMSQENEILRKDAELKTSQLQQQMMLVYLGVAAILFLSVISILLYRNIGHKKNLNQMLEEYNTDLKLQVNSRTKELADSNLELVRQNNQLEQFGYTIAHNLKGAVARISGLANLLKKEKFDREDQDLIQMLISSAHELDNSIQDLNEILEVKKGISNSIQRIDFSTRLEKVKSMLKERIHDSQATIQADFKKAESCFAIHAYLDSILYNLISNAIKYRAPERSPVIKIKSTHENNHIVLTVEDNGIGIDLEKFKKKVFTLYNRFHSHVEGKGMGLFLVKTQVEALKGSIEIDSEINRGTIFTISLPATPLFPES